MLNECSLTELEFTINLLWAGLGEGRMADMGVTYINDSPRIIRFFRALLHGRVESSLMMEA